MKTRSLRSELVKSVWNRVSDLAGSVTGLRFVMLSLSCLECLMYGLTDLTTLVL
jgi:hypothetical protein